MKKTALTALFLSFFLLSTTSAQIIITEIMYNPPEFGQDSLEYIELYNGYRADINLKGYSFTAGVNFTFGDTILRGGSYMVIAVNAQAMQSVFGFTPLQWTSGGLRNSGETIAIADESGNPIDSVSYSTSGQWPEDAAGKGHSLELCSVSKDNGIGRFWKASNTDAMVMINGKELYGSPGKPNNVSCSDYIIELSNFRFTPSELTIKVGQTVEWQNKEGRHNVNGKKNVYPSNPVGFYSGAPKTGSWSYSFRFDSIGDYEYRCDPHVARGMTGVIHVVKDEIPDLVINEIMYNPPAGSDDSLEYVEIYNNSGRPVLLKGIHFTAGIVAILPDSTLPADSYLVVAKDSAAYQNIFGNTAIQWSLGSLINSGEKIELSTALNSVIDEVIYGTQGDWPSEADGSGYSLELCDPDSDNGNANSWGLENGSTGVTINGIDIKASPGFQNDCIKMETELPLYTIDVLRPVDETGIPDSLGVKCKVRGVVYGVDLQKGTRLQFTLFDRSVNMGMGVFGTDKNRYVVQEGDSIEAKGSVGFFNGLTQIICTEIKVLAQNRLLVAPLVVDSLGEYTESRLIKIEDVAISDTSKWKSNGRFFVVPVSNGTRTFSLYIDESVDLSMMKAPQGRLNITGIGGQFDPSEPYLSGYQIAPRYKEDIEIINHTLNTSKPANISVFPNPVTDRIFVRPEHEINLLELWSINGVLLIHGLPNESQLYFEGMLKGTYLLRIQMKDGRNMWKRIVKI